MPTQNDLHLFSLRWADWHRSRRLFAPPPPKNLLAKMRDPTGGGEPPDAECEAALQLFNRALMAQPASPARMAFLCYYLHRVRMRDLMDHYDLSQQTLWKRIDDFRRRADNARLLLECSRYLDENVIDLAERRRESIAHAQEVRLARAVMRRAMENEIIEKVVKSADYHYDSARV